mgnify:CR=1 FL=1
MWAGFEEDQHPVAGPQEDYPAGTQAVQAADLAQLKRPKRAASKAEAKKDHLVRYSLQQSVQGGREAISMLWVSEMGKDIFRILHFQ